MGKTSIQIVNDQNPLEIRISGPLNEQSSTELLPIIEAVRDSCRIRLGEVSSINSLGTMAWVRFINLLGQKCSNITLTECSIDFVSQANMISGFNGLGRIVSFFGQYFCAQCPHEESKLFQSSEIFANPDDIEDRLSDGIICVKCGSAMELGEDTKVFIQRQLRSQTQQKKVS